MKNFLIIVVCITLGVLSSSFKFALLMFAVTHICAFLIKKDVEVKNRHVVSAVPKTTPAPKIQKASRSKRHEKYSIHYDEELHNYMEELNDYSMPHKISSKRF